MNPITPKTLGEIYRANWPGAYITNEISAEIANCMAAEGVTPTTDEVRKAVMSIADESPKDPPGALVLVRRIQRNRSGKPSTCGKFQPPADFAAYLASLPDAVAVWDAICYSGDDWLYGDSGTQPNPNRLQVDGDRDQVIAAAFKIADHAGIEYRRPKYKPIPFPDMRKTHREGSRSYF